MGLLLGLWHAHDYFRAEAGERSIQGPRRRQVKPAASFHRDSYKAKVRHPAVTKLHAVRYTQALSQSYVLKAVLALSIARIMH